MTLNIYEVLFSLYSHIFSEVIYHFSSTGTWKSDDAKYIRGAMFVLFSYLAKWFITFSRQARGKVMTLNRIIDFVNHDVYGKWSQPQMYKLRFPSLSPKKTQYRNRQDVNRLIIVYDLFFVFVTSTQIYRRHFSPLSPMKNEKAPNKISPYIFSVITFHRWHRCTTQSNAKYIRSWPQAEYI